MDSSALLLETVVPTNVRPRKVYLQLHRDLPAPWIAHSDFVPQSMVEHLMRSKKDDAIAVKFEEENKPPDSITNMEGALHTFVNPIVKATIHGDYQWYKGHSTFCFGSQNGHQLGRRVLVSALVQPDFENERVMLRVCGATPNPTFGERNLPRMISDKDKQDRGLRRDYDEAIRQYLVHWLTASHRLPPRHIAEAHSFTVRETVAYLERALNEQEVDMRSIIEDYFIRHKSHLLSLEMMFKTAVCMVNNEFFLLERVCPDEGYVYTFNPPAIFAQALGEDHGIHLLSLIHVAAIKYVANNRTFQHCKCIAWADFASPNIIDLLQRALRKQPHIKVRRTNQIFVAGKPSSEKQGFGLYEPPAGAEGAVLVIHNNSDAFGQNIETEGTGGSLDGEIGVYSSTAGSLMRDRPDLCNSMFRVPLY
jgi:hypothetical protein